MTLEEIARGVRSVDFEALMPAAMARHEPDVVEHAPRVEQLPVELQAAMHAGQRAEMVDAARVIEEQLSLCIADELGDSARELAVRDRCVGR
jgi:hypothetical protein